MKLYLTQEFSEFTYTVELSLCTALSKSFIQNFIQTFNIAEFMNVTMTSFGTHAFLSLPNMVKNIHCEILVKSPSRYNDKMRFINMTVN